MGYGSTWPSRWRAGRLIRRCDDAKTRFTRGDQARGEAGRSQAQDTPVAGEKRKLKATVAAVYSIERQVRTPGSIRGVESQKEKAPQVRARHNRVWASVERSPKGDRGGL